MSLKSGSSAPNATIFFSEGFHNNHPVCSLDTCWDRAFNASKPGQSWQDGKGEQPEVLFTYPSLMGDYNKIWWPSLQDGVGLLTCFSPRDDPVQLPSSMSVAIQFPRQDHQAAGVTRLGPDGCFLYFDVMLSISGGFSRATVRLARTSMERSGLTR